MDTKLFYMIMAFDHAPVQWTAISPSSLASMPRHKCRCPQPRQQTQANRNPLASPQAAGIQGLQGHLHGKQKGHAHERFLSCVQNTSLQEYLEPVSRRSTPQEANNP